MKTVWITGASSGIGEALAFEYYSNGWSLVLSSRREAELVRLAERLSGGAACAECECGDTATTSCDNKNHTAGSDRILVLPLDLCNSSYFAELAQRVVSKFGKIDLLILNGGISQRSLVRETPLEIDRKIMEVDYFGSVALCKAALPYMLKEKQGHIVAVSSIVGIFGFPQRSAYSAAKHALHGFFETLRAEESQNGISVTVVCPGRILTNISLHALKADGSEHAVMDHAQKNGISAQKCAKKIFRAVEKKKKEVYVCRKDILMVYFRRYIPYLYYALVGKVKPN